MIIIKFGRWCSAHLVWLSYERIYYKGYRWTPFCRVEWRKLARVHLSRRYRFCQWLQRYWLWLASLLPWVFVVSQCGCPGGVCPF